jgi:hypothetical protein
MKDFFTLNWICFWNLYHFSCQFQSYKVSQVVLYPIRPWGNNSVDVCSSNHSFARVEIKSVSPGML